MRYNVEANILTMVLIGTRENLPDKFTKIPAKHMRDYIFGKLTY